MHLLLYIDPGSGSFLLQMIIGAFLGVSFFFKALRYKIKSFFSKEKTNNDVTGSNNES